MIKVLHRINTVKELRNVPIQYGVEIDVRGFGDKLILNHEALQSGESFEKFLSIYAHRLLIVNVKEAGIEDVVLALLQKYRVNDFFLLDVEFPYLYRAARQGIRNIAIRYSEDEAIETVLNYKGLVDWVWIDTNTILPLNKKIVSLLSGFKTCLVCPERWGRPNDISEYKKKMDRLDFKLDAVMTNKNYLDRWK